MTKRLLMEISLGLETVIPLFPEIIREIVFYFSQTDNQVRIIIDPIAGVLIIIMIGN